MLLSSNLGPSSQLLEDSSVELNNVRRTLIKKRIHGLDEQPELFLVRTQAFCVSRRKLLELFNIFVMVHPECERGRTSGFLEFWKEGSVRAGISQVDFESVSLELEIVKDPGPEKTEKVGGPRELVAGNDLFGDGSSANYVPTFKNAGSI